MDGVSLEVKTHLSVSPAVKSERQMPHGSPARATVGLVSSSDTTETAEAAAVHVAVGSDARSSSVAPEVCRR